MVERKTNKHVTCRPLRSETLLIPASPNTLASNANGWGFFFGCRCPPSPPLRTLSTATSSLAPKRESEGVPSCLFLPPQRLLAPRPCLSMPSLCCVSAPSCTTRLCPLCQRPSLHFGVCRCKAACRNSGAVQFGLKNNNSIVVAQVGASSQW